MTSIRDAVIERSGGRCEVMIRLPRTWTRCGRAPVEDHHALTRARGGDLLDTVGETYHHIACCPRHHRMVDDAGPESGLMIQGYAWLDGGRIVYEGPDEYLSAAYPRVRQVQAVPGEVPVLGVRDDLRGAGPDHEPRGVLQ